MPVINMQYYQISFMYINGDGVKAGQGRGFLGQKQDGEGDKDGFQMGPGTKTGREGAKEYLSCRLVVIAIYCYTIS